MRAGIPYRIYGGVKFYARREVKDTLAYLYVIQNPYDTVNLLRIINVPSRKLGDTTLEKLQQFASTEHLTLWDALRRAEDVPDLAGGTKERIAAFVAIIGQNRARAEHTVVSELTAALLDDIHMETWLKEGEEAEEGEERWQNVQELLTVTHKYDALAPALSLTSFLEEVALVSEVDRFGEGGIDALTLMTLHLCKGLEFEHVIIVGCEEGLFPHSNSMYDKGQLEEERRIMYVGMTRAKSQLRLMFAQSRFLWGQNKSGAPSRFLDDLPDNVVERRSEDILSAFAWAGTRGLERAHGRKLEPFRQSEGLSLELNQDISFDDANQSAIEEGTRLEHPVFGKGTVCARRGDIVDIRFDGGQKKTFALSIAPLKVL